jgi:hypothetical protein
MMVKYENLVFLYQGFYVFFCFRGLNKKIIEVKEKGKMYYLAILYTSIQSKTVDFYSYVSSSKSLS